MYEEEDTCEYSSIGGVIEDRMVPGGYMMM
jgi:hypothetical protein